MGWLVLEMTGSPLWVGVSFAARSAPGFFLGVFSGSLVDRFDRRLTLKVTTVGSVIVAALTALVLLTDRAQLWHVLLLTLASGAVFVVNQNARYAYTYDVVGRQHALNGMALNQMSMRIGGVAGAVLAGTLIAVAGVGQQYLAVAATYVAAFAILLAVRGVGEAAPLQREPVLASVAGYFRLLAENRVLMNLMFLAAATEILGFTHFSLLPAFAKQVLDVGPASLGTMTAVVHAGGIFGLIAMAGLGDYRKKGMLALAIATAFGLGEMAFWLSADYLYFLGVLVFINACAMGVDTLYKTLMQATVSNEQRGRAMGSWSLSIGMAPAGYVEVGWVAGVLGAQGALLIHGSLLAVIGAATALISPRMRRLE